MAAGIHAILIVLSQMKMAAVAVVAVTASLQANHPRTTEGCAGPANSASSVAPISRPREWMRRV